MAYLILKQFDPLSIHVWVEKLSDSDPRYIYDTLPEAEAKKLELENDDPSREYKIEEV